MSSSSNPQLFRLVEISLIHPTDRFYWIFREAWDDPAVTFHPLVGQRNRISYAVEEKIAAEVELPLQPLQAGLSAYLATVES